MADIDESDEKKLTIARPTGLENVAHDLTDNLETPPSPMFTYKAKLSNNVACPRRVVAFTDKLGNISAGLQAPVTEADYTPTADLIMPENSMFGRELQQHFDAILHQSKNGVTTTNIMLDYFTELYNSYRAFTTAMAKNAQAQLSKLKKIPNKGDRMDVCFKKCCKLLEHSSKLAQRYSEKNQKFYNEVVKDFTKFQVVHTEEAKEVSRRAEVLKSGLAEQNNIVKQEKETTISFLRLTPAKKLATISMKISKKNKLSQEETDMIKKLDLQAIGKYQAKCRQANELANLNRFRWWPAMLTKVQLREERRINQIRKTFNTYAKNEKACHNIFTETSSNLMQELTNIDTPTVNDINGFVEKCHVDMPPDSDKAKHDFLPRYPFDISNEIFDLPDDHKTDELYSSNLPISPSFSKKRVGEERKKPSSRACDLNLFSDCLANVMAYQAKESPTLSAGTDIPIIVDFLVGAIQKIGLKSEGLFRIPPSKIQAEVDHLQRQMESGHYLLPEGIPPHVVAALLQLWFENLTEPLVPYKMHETCMTLANERLSNTTGGQEEEFLRLKKILNDLPSTNRRVILRLLNLLSSLIANERFNKVGVRDVGDVFSPAFFRPENTNLGAIEVLKVQNNSLYLFQRLVALYNSGISEDKGGRIMIENGGLNETSIGVEGEDHHLEDDGEEKKEESNLPDKVESMFQNLLSEEGQQEGANTDPDSMAL